MTLTVTRRGFLASCLALAAAPAIVRASSLMPVVVRRAPLITFPGCHDSGSMLFVALYAADTFLEGGPTVSGLKEYARVAVPRNDVMWSIKDGVARNEAAIEFPQHRPGAPGVQVCEARIILADQTMMKINLTRPMVMSDGCTAAFGPGDLIITAN